ncbi:hypothetical protein DAPPUDRAFT_326638 [Daphnia pulex]|uniref:Uncharacterized protein n=1 Tax=Daphnia pulex TaxID=6669 RepID=E9H8B4_DAPPU|nr:hypothetical protein DAPPUDRAFT_326638 [Daphnia pulex]|eukprot:EFX72040.1 hypothetical protein DAPPUDRAFT_326638 [Daphnia pulex]
MYVVHVVQPTLDKKIKDEGWNKTEIRFKQRNDFGFILLVFIGGIKFKVTSVDHIKEKAVTDAYMRMYKLLFQSGKVSACRFHKMINDGLNQTAYYRGTIYYTAKYRGISLNLC